MPIVGTWLFGIDLKLARNHPARYFRVSHLVDRVLWSFMRGFWVCVVVAGCGVPESLSTTSDPIRISPLSSTTGANNAAISGTDVVWDEEPLTIGGSDVIHYGLTTEMVVNLTPTTPDTLEGDQEVHDGAVVWDYFGRGSIILHELATGQRTVVAEGMLARYYYAPSIHGRYVAYVAFSPPQHPDIELYDRLLGTVQPVTNDSATQIRPRVAADHVVYEDYSTGDDNPDIWAFQISTGARIAIATGPTFQQDPDIAGTNIVYVDATTVAAQLWMYDLVTDTRRPISAIVPSLGHPRISGSHVVWTDFRNGDADVYGYDFATGTEVPVVVAPGDQFNSDVDGDVVVYTDTTDGIAAIYMTAFPKPPPPEELPPGCDPRLTTAIAATTELVRTGARPAYASGSYVADDPMATYSMCIENGRPDGSERAAQALVRHDRRVLLTPARFDAHWIAAQLDAVTSATNNWSAAIFGRDPPNRIRITIRKRR